MRRGKTRQVKGVRGRYNVIYAYYDESVGLAAGELAVKLVNDLISPDPDFDFEAELERFIVRGERTAFGPSTQAIVDEAVSRDIPYLRLNTASLVQLGQGVHQKRIRATMTSQTSSVAVDIASNKELTLSLLSAAGLPVPKSASVRTGRGRRPAGQPDRLPGGAEAAGRQPRPGRDARPAERRRRPEGFRHRQVRIARRTGHRRDLRDGPGLPLPGDRRQDRRDRRAGARARGRRRPLDDPATGGHHQRRSAPRCGAREGADPDQGRPGGDRAGAVPGLRAGRRAARRHRRSS